MKNTIKLFILMASMFLGVTYAAQHATQTFNGTGLDTLGTSTYAYVLSIRKRGQRVIGTMTVTEGVGLLGTFPLENGSIHGNVISFLVEDDEGFRSSCKAVLDSNEYDCKTKRTYKIIYYLPERGIHFPLVTTRCCGSPHFYH